MSLCVHTRELLEKIEPLIEDASDVQDATSRIKGHFPSEHRVQVVSQSDTMFYIRFCYLGRMVKGGYRPWNIGTLTCKKKLRS